MGIIFNLWSEGWVKVKVKVTALSEGKTRSSRLYNSNLGIWYAYFAQLKSLFYFSIGAGASLSLISYRRWKYNFIPIPSF